VITYVDSSALVPVYVPERFSRAARQVIRATPSVPFTDLHQLEVPNAFALLLGRGLISAEQHRAVRAHLQEDLDAGRLVRVAVDWPEVFAVAQQLSDSFTASLLTRSLDLVHVAAARAARYRFFVSADDRQLAAARAAGIEAVDIRRGVRGARR